jgi:hypothetical protein
MNATQFVEMVSRMQTGESETMDRLIAEALLAAHSPDEKEQEVLGRCNYYFGGDCGGNRCQLMEGHQEGHLWEAGKEQEVLGQGSPVTDKTAELPLVTPQMMSKVFAKSINRKDPEHEHIYDHRIAADELNKLLALATPAHSPSEEAPVYDEIRLERKAQDEKWGGPSHDDGHSGPDWASFIKQHANKAFRGDYRKQMIRVAALAVAAIESFDRKSGPALAAASSREQQP